MFGHKADEQHDRFAHWQHLNVTDVSLSPRPIVTQEEGWIFNNDMFFIAVKAQDNHCLSSYWS